MCRTLASDLGSDHHRTTVRVAVRVMVSSRIFQVDNLIRVLALAIAVTAKPVVERKLLPVRLPLTKRRSVVNYNVMESDRRRCKFS